MMNEHGKSDRPILPKKSSNKVGTLAAEGTEERGLAKENTRQQNAFRTQRRGDVPNALERVREAARKNKGTRFTALFHNVYDPDMLRYAFYQLKKEASPGVDGETWRHYVEDLEHNDTVQHALLLDKVAKRVRDDQVMRLLKMILKAT